MDAALWSRAVALYEAALSMPPEARLRWTRSKEASDRGAVELAERLLAAHAHVETADAFRTLPKLANPRTNAGHAGKQIAGFILTESLGRGGMGEVWRARYADARIEREVAIKLPTAFSSPQNEDALRERFAREQRFLAKLEHPHIARLYDAGLSGKGEAFLALELIEGEAIDVHCANNALSLRERIELFLQVIDAVDFAHRQLVLHRDLKPSNVMIDSRGQAKLLDFGVAKLMHSGERSTPGDALTELAGAAVTLAYAAPEQIRDGELSTATDVYALGVMLYRIVTGCSPYEPASDTRYALEQSVLHEIPKRPSERLVSDDFARSCSTSATALRHSLRGDLDLILAKVLKKHPNERYSAAAAFGEDLRRYLKQQPITARPDSLAYRVECFVARHRLAVTAGAAASVAILAASVIAFHHAAETARQLSRAEAAQSFVAGLFANADPEQIRGKPMLAKDILQKGVSDAKRLFANDPEALSKVLAQVGDIYFRLGLPEPLLEVQTARVSALRLVRGKDPNQWVDALTALGQAQSNAPSLSNRLQAIESFNEALSVGGTNAAVSVDRRVFAMAMTADQHRIYQRLEKAETVAVEATTLAAKALPSSHASAIAALQVRALVARDRGQIDDARELMQKVIAADRATQSRGEIDRFNAARQFASIEFEAAEYLNARDSARSLLTQASQDLGELNIHFAALRRLVVSAAERAGSVSEASEEVAAMLAAELTADDPFRRGTAAFVAARVWLSADLLEKAQTSLSNAERELSAYPLWLNRLAALQAEYWLRRNDPERALAVIDLAFERASARNQNVSREVAALHEWRARVLVAQRNAPAASAHIAQACVLRAKFHPTNHPQRIACEALSALLDADLDRPAQLRRIGELRATLNARSDRLKLVQLIAQAQTQLAAGRSLENLALFSTE